MRGLCFTKFELGATGQSLRETNQLTCQGDPFGKRWFPIEGPENPGNNADFGSAESGGTIFIVNLIKRIARKLSRIILPHLGLVTFRIHYWKTRTPVMFRFSDFRTCP